MSNKHHSRIVGADGQPVGVSFEDAVGQTFVDHQQALVNLHNRLLICEQMLGAQGIEGIGVPSPGFVAADGVESSEAGIHLESEGEE